MSTNLNKIDEQIAEIEKKSILDTFVTLKDCSNEIINKSISKNDILGICYLISFAIIYIYNVKPEQLKAYDVILEPKLMEKYKQSPEYNNVILKYNQTIDFDNFKSCKLSLPETDYYENMLRELNSEKETYYKNNPTNIAYGLVINKKIRLIIKKVFENINKKFIDFITELYNKCESIGKTAEECEKIYCIRQIYSSSFIFLKLFDMSTIGCLERHGKILNEHIKTITNGEFDFNSMLKIQGFNYEFEGFKSDINEMINNDEKLSVDAISKEINSLLPEKYKDIKSILKNKDSGKKQYLKYKKKYLELKNKNCSS